MQPSVVHKSFRNEKWLISYQVKDGKIIEVLFSARGGDLVGWCQRMLFSKNKDVG